MQIYSKSMKNANSNKMLETLGNFELCSSQVVEHSIRINDNL